MRRLPISPSAGGMAARSSLLHDGCLIGGDLIQNYSTRAITNRSRWKEEGAGTFVLSPAIGAARRSSWLYRDWSTHCTAVVRLPIGAWPRSFFRDTELGETCSRAAAWFCKSAFGFRIYSRNVLYA